MRIYTKTGDTGTTGLVGGQRVPKTNPRIEVIGDLDELNALVGLARTQDLGQTQPLLEKIQNWLFDIGSEIACPPGGKLVVQSVDERHTGLLEHSIDEVWTALPQLRNFILPGGSDLAASLHLCRCASRRVERRALALHESEPVRVELLCFLNRLSDWFFTAARKANSDAGVEDVVWTKEQL